MLLCVVLSLADTASPVTAQRSPRTSGLVASPTQLLGRPTDRSVTLNVLAAHARDLYVEYGLASGTYSARTPLVNAPAGAPLEIEIGALAPNTRYYYRLRTREAPGGAFREEPEFTFHTQRATGSTFTFGVQGDSHPERAGRMYDATLYLRTMQHVQEGRPDFYVTLGDDFSIERLISQQNLTPASVNQVYASQRDFLGLVGRAAPIFLVNGNHEEAARFLLDGTPNSAAALAGRARTTFYALPAPDHFYTGDTAQVEHVGFLRDYYAWTWGDALFVVIDPYWHSVVPVDAAPGGGGGGRGGGGGGGGGGQRRGGQAGRGGNAQQASGLLRDQWNITIGDAQYQWLRTTLEQSTAKYKFVFAHHVMGTGRGAVEIADYFEWGGKDRRGEDLFRSKRPTWEMPIHQLMVRNGVTIFFQGHDHLFARQEKDGIIYQETPNPADATYQAFNRDAYRSGTILPNAGHLRVTVSPDDVRVDYIRSFLPKDTTTDQQDGAVAFSYRVKPRARR